VARVVQGVIDTSTVLAVYLLARLLSTPRRNLNIRGLSPSPGTPGEGWGASKQAPSLTLPRRTEGGNQREIEWGALLAAGIVAVNPYLIYFSGLLLSETLFTAMLAWSFVLLLYGGGASGVHERLAWWAGGLLLALSILVRPSALALPILMGFAVMLLSPRRAGAYQRSPGERSSIRWRLPVGAAMMVLTLLVLVPWGARNFRVLGAWVWLDTNSGFTLYDG